MARAPLQYTPAQVLQAGQQAEADGKIEYAVQFYRYVTDRYAATREAEAAELGLRRLAEAHGAVISALADAALLTGIATSANGTAEPEGEPLSRLRQRPAARTMHADPPRQTASQQPAAAAVRAPQRQGIFILPGACIVLGLLLAAAGIAILSLGVAAEIYGKPLLASDTLPSAPLTGVLVAMLGLGVATLGQVAHAVLSSAAISRALLELAQRKIEER